MRYRADGVLDSTFDADGIVIDSLPTVKGLAIQSDGKIVVGHNAYYGGNGFALVRYDTVGNIDASFGTNGYTLTNIGGSNNDYATAMCLQSDGKIVFSGNSSGSVMAVRYNNMTNSTGINYTKRSNDLLVYPNPATHSIMLSSQKVFGTIMIYNSLGQLVMSVPDKENIVQIDIRDLAPGVYTIKEGDKHCKLIKE